MDTLTKILLCNIEESIQELRLSCNDLSLVEYIDRMQEALELQGAILSLRKPLCAAKRALAEEDKPYQDPIFHIDPATHMVTALPAEIGEALRLADELVLACGKLQRGGLQREDTLGDIGKLARAYRQARGLDIAESGKLAGEMDEKP